MTRKITAKPAGKTAAVCSKCLSGKLVADAEAIWNLTEQRWEISEVHVEGGSPIGHCENCDDSCTIDMIDAARLDSEVELAIIKLQNALSRGSLERPGVQEALNEAIRLMRRSATMEKTEAP